MLGPIQRIARFQCFAQLSLSFLGVWRYGLPVRRVEQVLDTVNPQERRRLYSLVKNSQRGKEICDRGIVDIVPCIRFFLLSISIAKKYIRISSSS